MYSRQEASRLTEEFWTIFGQYMNPVLSAEGEKINWVNYKTGEKEVFFRMKTDGSTASIAIEIRHKDPLVQQLYYGQFNQLKKILEKHLEEKWTWILHDKDENGKLVSRIFITLSPVNIFRKEDWPALIGFFKKRIIGLDRFWSAAKFSFELLH